MKNNFKIYLSYNKCHGEPRRFESHWE